MCFPNVSQLCRTRNIFSSVNSVSKMQIMLPLHGIEFFPSMQTVAKILRARASEHSSNFCEQFEERPNFASTFKLNGTIPIPLSTSYTSRAPKAPETLGTSQNVTYLKVFFLSEKGASFCQKVHGKVPRETRLCSSLVLRDWHC